MGSNIDIVHAYRHLYRNLLKAVQYATPARLVARHQLRKAFREPGAAYDAEGIRRTVWFLEAAAKERGLEHKLLKNLLKVHRSREMVRGGWRQAYAESKRKPDAMDVHRKTAWRHYDMTVAMLNKSMGLCLR